MFKKVFVMLFVSVLLSACSETKTYDFFGESDHWNVKYEVEILNEQSEQTRIRIEYLGKEPIPQKVHYSIITNNGKAEGNATLNDKGVLEIGGHSCSGCAVITKDETIKTTITWEGNSDKLKLNRK